MRRLGASRRRVVTSGGELQSCPSPRVLSRFLDGALEEEAVLDVVDHIEHCRDCRFIVSETAAFRRSGALHAMAPAHGRTWWLAVAVVGVLVILAVPLAWPRTIGRRFDRLIARTPLRPIEARLSGLPYQRYAARRSARDLAEPRIRTLAEAGLSQRPQKAAEWHRRGIASLLKGDVS